MMQAGSNSGRTAYRASPETLPGPFLEGEGSAGSILSESEGARGSMIRHAPEPAACPVGPVPVAVIVPSLPASLVPPPGGPQLLAARFLPAAVPAVFVAPVTMTADPEHPATVRPPAKPLTQWFLMGPHGGVFGGPEQPRRAWQAGSYLQRMVGWFLRPGVNISIGSGRSGFSQTVLGPVLPEPPQPDRDRGPDIDWSR